MSIDIVQVFQRPNTNVLWFNETFPPSHMEYIQTNYKNNGKYEGISETTPDGLMLIITHKFKDQESLDEWKNDSYLTTMVSNRDEYNRINNIDRLV